MRDAVLYYAPIQNRCNDHRLVRRQRQPVVDHHNRQKIFDEKSDAGPVCQELRSLYPRNAEVIDIEANLDDPSVDMVPLFSPAVEC